MKPLIKSIYVRLLSKELFSISAEEVGERALEMMFAYRTLDESINFRNYQKAYQGAYQEEKEIYKFIVRHDIHE